MVEPQQVIEALKTVEADLVRLVSSADQTSRATQSAISDLEHELEQLERKLENDLDQAECELTDCENTVYYDQDGNASYPDCSSYRLAVQEVTDKLEQLAALILAFEQACAGYESQSRALQSVLDSTVAAACARLRDQQAALEKYERGDLSPAIGAIASILASPSMQGHINQRLGDLAEQRGKQVLRRMGASQAGHGLHYGGNQGIDVYGLRNTPKGRTLMLMEVKSTTDPRKTHLAKHMLTIGKDGLQQASPQWNKSREDRAHEHNRPAARRIAAARTRMDNTRIRRTESYVLWINFSTERERLYKAFPNRTRDRVEHLREIRF